MKNRIAIIPARGGSKRIPRKNIKNFCGRPMISYVLSELYKSQLFDEIHVSTDDNEISQVVTELGFPPTFYRSSSLADDHTPLFPVIQYVIRKYSELDISFDEVWLVMPCSPFIKANDFIHAQKIFERNNCKQPIMSVGQYAAPIEWALKIRQTTILEPVVPGAFQIRSQDITPSYYDSGNFVIFSDSMIHQSSPKGFDVGYIPYVLDKWRAIDIDDEADWRFAEIVFKAISTNKK